VDWAKGEHKEHPATAERMRTSLVSAIEFFGKTPLHAIGAGELEDYKAWRRSCGIREITIRHDLHALSKLFQYGMKHRWCFRNATKLVSIPSDKDAVRQHVLTVDEEGAYFGGMVAGSTLHDAARLILLTGMRPEEVLGLEQASVNLEHGTVFVVRGKSIAARRLLALVPEAVEILKRRMEKPGRYVFGSARGAVKRVNGSHDRVLARLNREHPEAPLHFVLYDLRHTFATRMAEAGCPLSVLAAILGHANLRTIHRYVHVRPAVQQEAMLRYATASLSRSKIGPSPASKVGEIEGCGGNPDAQGRKRPS
jgi:site-specific recombinase XerD